MIKHHIFQGRSPDNRIPIHLLGFGYSLYSNGKYRDGYGVDTKTIFAVMNNEDFSHDMFHYYSGQINKRENRNWITEEGIAYAWGNAYYTDKNGEMISNKRLITELKDYLAKNPNKLNAVRKKLELNKHSKPLFNTSLFAKHLEDAYIQMYERLLIQEQIHDRNS